MMRKVVRCKVANAARRHQCRHAAMPPRFAANCAAAAGQRGSGGGGGGAPRLGAAWERAPSPDSARFPGPAWERRRGGGNPPAQGTAGERRHTRRGAIGRARRCGARAPRSRAAAAAAIVLPLRRAGSRGAGTPRVGGQRGVPSPCTIGWRGGRPRRVALIPTGTALPIRPSELGGRFGHARHALSGAE
eukprot:gene17659-biopygen4708